MAELTPYYLFLSKRETIDNWDNIKWEKYCSCRPSEYGMGCIPISRIHETMNWVRKSFGVISEVETKNGVKLYFDDEESMFKFSLLYL